jgi:hypothetical protein
MQFCYLENGKELVRKIWVRTSSQQMLKQSKKIINSAAMAAKAAQKE